MGNRVFDVIRQLLDELEATQADNIEAAARLEVETFKRGGILQAYGVGHSEGGASEICHRAGGFIPTKKLRDPTFGLYQDIPGVGTQFLESVDLRAEDTLVLISNSGRNNMIVEMAIEAKRRGCGVIVVTSLEASKRLTPKHKGGKNLYAYGDVVLDNRVMDGDSSIQLEGMDSRICGMSSITTAALLQAVMCRATEIFLEEGIVPPVYMSANVDGGREYNKKLEEQYKDRLR